VSERVLRVETKRESAPCAGAPGLEARDALAGIPGLAPSLRDLPSGCAFHPRCGLGADRCRSERPVLRDVAGAQVACHLA